MSTHNNQFISNVNKNVNYNIKLNLYNPEDNDYFLDLIRRFNLNKDHFIIKINNELDEFILDENQTFYYVKSKFSEIVDYMNKHSKERVLGLILMDRILHMLPDPMINLESSLNDLVYWIRYENKFHCVDDVAKFVNEVLETAKEINCIRDSVTHFKRKLEKYVRKHGGSYKFNNDCNPFLKEGGDDLFN